MADLGSTTSATAVDVAVDDEAAADAGADGDVKDW